MEEKKGITMKLSEDTAKEAKQPKKLSYEELENIAHQLSEQAKQLYQKLQEADRSNLFMRLDYLFKVVQNADKFTQEFVDQCTNEIIELVTIPEEPVYEPTEEVAE